MATQPTPASFDDAYKEAVAYAKAEVTHYDTLTFASSLEASFVQIVLDDAPLVTPQGTYIPCAADFTPAETEGGIVGRLEINIAYLPPAAYAWMERAAADGAHLTTTWRQYLASGVDPSFMSRLPFDITSSRYTNGQCIITCTLPDLVNTPFCRRLMTANVLPGLAGL